MSHNANQTTPCFHRIACHCDVDGCPFNWFSVDRANDSQRAEVLEAALEHVVFTGHKVVIDEVMRSHCVVSEPWTVDDILAREG
jgi:hypothetical protein